MSKSKNVLLFSSNLNICILDSELSCSRRILRYIYIYIDFSLTLCILSRSGKIYLEKVEYSCISFTIIRGGSRTAAPSKVELFVIIALLSQKAPPWMVQQF